MTPNLHLEIQQVAEKIETHSKDSKEFYWEMRLNVWSIKWELQEFRHELSTLQKNTIEMDLKIQNFEKKIEKFDKRGDEFEKKFIYIIASLVFLGFLVLILFAQ